jgi:hypothetical protein
MLWCASLVGKMVNTKSIVGGRGKIVDMEIVCMMDTITTKRKV